jgi:hypothetical protein
VRGFLLCRAKGPSPILSSAYRGEVKASLLASYSPVRTLQS